MKKKTVRERIGYLWNKLRVFFGFSVWVRTIHCRPKFQICPYHNHKMKRGRKTLIGAFYWCSKCKKAYHLKGGSSKLVPALEEK